MSPKVSAAYMRARREEILEAATRVFSEKGFHAATLDDVAEQAEMSKGTLYTHFDSKEAIIDGLSELWRTIDDAVFDAAEQKAKAIDGLAYATKAMIERAGRPDFISSVRLGLFVWAEVLTNPAVQKSQERLGEIWTERMLGLAVKARDDGEMGPQHDPRAVVTFLGSLGVGLFVGRAWGAALDAESLKGLVDLFIESLGRDATG